MSGRFFHEPAPGLGFVDLVVGFDLGSEADPPGREGESLLASRLVRYGTAALSRAAVDARVERMGAQLESGTGLNRVTFRGRVIRERVEEFAGLLRELILEPAFREADFVQARDLLAAELVAERDEDSDLAGRAFRRALFADHPAGRPASGTVASVRTLDPAACRASHHDRMGRDTLVVGVAGDATEAEARRWFLDPYLQLPPAARRSRVDPPDPAPPRGRRLLLVDKPERTQTQIYLGHFGPRPGAPHHDALSVATTAFGGTFTSRLMQEVRVKRGWSYGAYARLSRSRRDDAYYLWTFPKNEDTAPCVALQLDLLRELRDQGVPDHDLRFAQGYLVGASVFLFDTPADRLERRIEVATLDFPPDYYTAIRQRIEAVTPEAARATTAARIRPDDLVIAVLCTASAVEGPLRELLGPDAAVEIRAFDDEAF